MMRDIIAFPPKTMLFTPLPAAVFDVGSKQQLYIPDDVGNGEGTTPLVLGSRLIALFL